MSAFDRLHPALQHHIVNDLGWKSLRPLQESAIVPLIEEEHALLLAGTAGGKTEAAVFPLLSRMLAEDWRGLSVVYLCPIKALLNNLEVRLAAYGRWLGRRAELWHGDVSESARNRIRRDPPDILLTTPESLEVMLVSRRHDPAALFAGVRAVVVDEIHAFAGDDRGWHLLAVVERICRLARDPVQRIGLSATIGNPEEILAWLSGSAAGPRRVVAAAADAAAAPEIQLDHVGSLENAARVIAGLHRGEKRLVFCDSRARVEELAARLREGGVATFVSHGSLGLDERRQAEAAFAAGRDCVIVATSTLELGIDVGDLDRIVQIDAPATVSSFLQRLGRTGRRPGTVRNCLFLTTSEGAFLRAAGLLRLWSTGFVEPVVPPPEPFHVLAQQLLALSLQEGGIGRSSWREWIGGVPGFAALPPDDVEAMIGHMLATGILFEEAGLLSIGPEGERLYGARHFLELFSVFSSPPLVAVLHGRTELGSVHESTFLVRREGPPVLLLGGRSWRVTHLDWVRRQAFVEPAEDRGKSNWLGPGQPLHFRLCRAIRTVLATGTCPVWLSQRAQAALETLLARFAWVTDDATTVVQEAGGRCRWWTFAGIFANAVLAETFRAVLSVEGREDNLFVALLEGLAAGEAENQLLAGTRDRQPLAPPPIDDAALRGLKFSECLPPPLARRLLQRRLWNEEALEACVREPIRLASGGDQER